MENQQQHPAPHGHPHHDHQPLHRPVNPHLHLHAHLLFGHHDIQLKIQSENSLHPGLSLLNFIRLICVPLTVSGVKK